jgi:hypothetical protein
MAILLRAAIQRSPLAAVGTVAIATVAQGVLLAVVRARSRPPKHSQDAKNGQNPGVALDTGEMTVV